MCSEVNKDDDLVEDLRVHEHVEHEHEDLSEYIVFSLLFKDVFSELSKNVLDKLSLTIK
jgi:hypothetical protein